MQFGERLRKVLQDKKFEILTDWLQKLDACTWPVGLVDRDELGSRADRFLELLLAACQEFPVRDFQATAWNNICSYFESLVCSWMQRGVENHGLAVFLLVLKTHLLERLSQEEGLDKSSLVQGLLEVDRLFDRLTVLLLESSLNVRQGIIERQERELLELSTPVIKIWEGILVLPLIGTLDSVRTQIVMESLLQKILQLESKVAIIDIRSVPTVDRSVAQHLLKTIAAARLMGAECILSGIRPALAQTMVQEGLGFGDVKTKASLADALEIGLKMLGLQILRTADRGSGE